MRGRQSATRLLPRWSLSQVPILQIDGRSPADLGEVMSKPRLCTSSPNRTQVKQEIQVRVELRSDTELLHHDIGIDRVNVHPLHLVARQSAILDQRVDEADRAHLAHQ